jgi:hypothetical protein
MSSISFFDTSEQADEATRLASSWMPEQKLEKALPDPPKITKRNSTRHGVWQARLFPAFAPRSISRQAEDRDLQGQRG